jgi:ubiquinol-cytochrome c reductase cytochrome b subunit
MSFGRIQYICREVHLGWLIRIVHFNCANFIFLILYFHILKGLFISSHRLKKVWVRGIILFYLISATAFTGYSLVWSQIRYWAIVVITNFLGVFPYFGESLLYWVWGGYTISRATLKLFFTLHFLIPWLIFIIIIVHLLKLHEVGRTRILGYRGSLFKVRFWPYYWTIDLINIIPLGLMLLFSLSYPYYLGEPEIFIEANPIVSPLHITPEWYFCAFYAVLRVIPNKGWGIFFLVISLILPFLIVFINNYLSPLVLLLRILIYIFIFNFIFLRWLGQCSIEEPFIMLIVFSTFIYFFLLFIIILSFYIRRTLFTGSFFRLKYFSLTSTLSFLIFNVKVFNLKIKYFIGLRYLLLQLFFWVF